MPSSVALPDADSLSQPLTAVVLADTRSSQSSTAGTLPLPAPIAAIVFTLLRGSSSSTVSSGVPSPALRCPVPRPSPPSPPSPLPTSRPHPHTAFPRSAPQLRSRTHPRLRSTRTSSSSSARPSTSSQAGARKGPTATRRRLDWWPTTNHRPSPRKAQSLHSGLHHSYGIPSSSADAFTSPAHRARVLQSLGEHQRRVQEIHAGMRAARRALLFEQPQVSAEAEGKVEMVEEAETKSEANDSEDVEEDVSAVELVDDQLEL